MPDAQTTTSAPARAALLTGGTVTTITLRLKALSRSSGVVTSGTG
ncbi:hypothetical protein [Streptomyces wuyuanensis]